MNANARGSWGCIYTTTSIWSAKFTAAAVFSTSTFLSTNGVRTRLLRTRPRMYSFYHTRAHLLTLHSFLAGSPRVTPALQPIRTNTLPPTYRLVTPSLRLLTCILLYNVRFPIPYPLSSARHVTVSSCFPPRSLPKKGLPLQEIAVALIASLLGGFGTVAMFCTLGVYV